MSSLIEHEEERIQQTIIDSVKLFASQSKGYWEVEKMPELSAMKVTYLRKLKFAPFTQYRLDKMIQYDLIRYHKNFMQVISCTLENMKKELDTEVLDQLTE